MRTVILLAACVAARAEHAAHVPVQLASTVRFDPPLEGRLHSLGEGPVKLTITPSVARQATLSWGNDASWVGVADRVGAGEALRVWVLGASPSCGHQSTVHLSGGPPQEAAVGLNHTFGGVLLTGLSALYPGAHEVTTECHGGAATDRWTQEVAHWRMMHEGPFKKGADIVIVEAGLTDGGEARVVHRVNEILLRQLFAATPRPAVILLSSAGVREWSGPKQRTSDAARVHQVVATHYGVRQVSPVDALEPFEMAGRVDWLLTRLRSDLSGHPSLVGHDLIGGLLLHAVAEQVACARSRFLPSDPPPLPRQPALAYNRASEVAAFVRGRPKVLRLDERDDTQRGFDYWKPTPSNWTLYADGQDPGLIAHDVGAVLEFEFPPNVVRQNFRYKTAVVTVLKTYEGTGTLRARVSAGAWKGGPEWGEGKGTCVAHREMCTKVVDTLWTNHYSEPVGEELVDLEHLQDGSCVIIEVMVIASTPPRVHNKVKLYSLAIY